MTRLEDLLEPNAERQLIPVRKGRGAVRATRAHRDRTKYDRPSAKRREADLPMMEPKD